MGVNKLNQCATDEAIKKIYQCNESEIINADGASVVLLRYFELFCAERGRAWVDLIPIAPFGQ